MIKLHYQTAEELGHHPVPLIWNTQTNAPVSHVQGWEAMQPYLIKQLHIVSR